MIARASSPLLLAVALGCSSSNASPATEDAGDDAPVEASPKTSATFSVEKTLTITSTTTEHLAFPSVTRLRDGRLLLVYRKGATHVDATGRIMKQFGSADGTTWSAPEVLYDAPDIDDRDPSVTTLSNGDVLVDYFQYESVTTADGNVAVHHVFVGRSTDDGKTFGSFVQADDGSMSPSNPKLDAMGRWVDDTGKALVVRACSSPIVEIGGRLLLPAYGGNPLNLGDLASTPKSRISLLESTDGTSWTEVPVLGTEATDSWLQEPVLLRLSNGTTVTQIRTAKGSSPSNAGKLMQATSADDGKTWSSLTALPFVGHAPALAEMKSGLLLSGYRQINDALTHEWTSFSWSLDGASTWSAPIQVKDCKAVECGYPSIVELDAQRFLFVYYAPGGTAIEAVIERYDLQ